MKVPKNKVQVRVRMVAIPQVEYRYSYWDIYPDVYIDISDEIPKNEKRDLEYLFRETFYEFPDQESPELDVHVTLSIERFIKIADKLNIELSKECLRLKDLLPIEVKTIEEYKGGE